MSLRIELENGREETHEPPLTAQFGSRGGGGFSIRCLTQGCATFTYDSYTCDVPQLGPGIVHDEVIVVLRGREVLFERATAHINASPACLIVNYKPPGAP
jgi:hypothetical protein